MSSLKIFAFSLFAIIAIYTIFVVASHGTWFLSTFVADILAVSWNGQFNLDFLGYLLVTALWVAWRHRFTPTGIGLGLIASVGGMLFFAPYLLYATFKSNGDMKVLLTGNHA